MFGWGIPEFLLLFVAIPGTIFWIWMLIDAATKERDSTDKVVWVLIILFTHFIGGAIYYFVRYRARRGR
jgi:hypothetical protein